MSEPYDNLLTLLDHLTAGWLERVEFKVHVFMHTVQCMKTRDPRFLCDCPTVVEKRVEMRQQGSLISQLHKSRLVVTVGGDKSGGHGSGGKPKSKPPGNLLAPDEIMWLLVTVTGDILDGLLSDHDHASTKYSTPTLDDIGPWLRKLGELYWTMSDEERKDATHRLGRVVKRCRVNLGYESSGSQFQDTLCSECSGALEVMHDRPTDVHCVGTPSKPRCGKVYPWYTWGELLAAGPVLVDTKTASTCLGVPAATIYRWARTKKIMRYGTRKQGQARWDLDELKSHQETLDKRRKKDDTTS